MGEMPLSIKNFICLPHRRDQEYPYGHDANVVVGCRERVRDRQLTGLVPLYHTVMIERIGLVPCEPTSLFPIAFYLPSWGWGRQLTEARCSWPHSGLRPFHQKSTCLTSFTSGAYVVQIWSRATLDLRGNETLVRHRAVRVRRARGGVCTNGIV